MSPNGSRDILMYRFNKRPAGKLYHYTRIDTLLSMLDIHREKKHSELWLSNSAYLNDTHEISLGIKLFKEKIEALQFELIHKGLLELFQLFIYNLNFEENKNANIFIMSFSEKKDSLNQWRSYTPHGKGISLGFYFYDCSNYLLDNGMQLTKCIYKKKEQEEVIAELVNHLIGVFSEFGPYEDRKSVFASLKNDSKFEFLWKSNMSYSYKIFALLKDSAFEEESEWRLISMNSGEHRIDVSYRAGSSMLLPHIKIPISLEEYLRVIDVGPTSHTGLSKLAVKGLLGGSGLNGVVISESKIPYREWV